MMNLFKIYRPVWQFLLVFFGTYGVFSGLYFYYLDYWSVHGQGGIRLPMLWGSKFNGPFNF